MSEQPAQFLEPPAAEDRVDNLQSERRESFRRYLEHQLNYWEGYHERKENMSWLLTTVYLAGLIAVLSLLFDNYSSTKPAVHAAVTLLTCVLVFPIGALVVLFYRQQSGNRRVAGAFVDACGRLLSRLIEPTEGVSRGDLLVDENDPYVGVNGTRHPVPEKLKQTLRGFRSHPERERINWHYLAPVAVMAIATLAFLLVLVGDFAITLLGI